MTTKITEISSKNNALADNGLWNPNLISDVTMVLGTSIDQSMKLQRKGFHHLAWTTSTSADDVTLEIRDNQQAKLIVNTSRYRSGREYLSLRGIAHKYDLIFDECEDE